MDNKAIEKLTDKEILYLREMMERMDQFFNKHQYTDENGVTLKLNIIKAVEILIQAEINSTRINPYKWGGE